MIKFFRKIRQNLLIENKTGRYFKYAIGEIVLVVIGILIALSINNWNNDLIERKKEGNLIANIHKEFQLNRIQLDSTIFYHSKVYQNTDKILNLVPVDIETVNIDSLSLYITETFNHYTFNPQQSSVNSLTSTSTFETISNLELRRLLQKWDELVKDYKEEETLFRDYSFDNFLPYISKHISLIAFTNRTNILDHHNVDYTFLNSLEFENAIALRKGLMSDVILGSELKEVNETIDRIIELTTTHL